MIFGNTDTNLAEVHVISGYLIGTLGVCPTAGVKADSISAYLKKLQDPEAINTKCALYQLGGLPLIAQTEEKSINYTNDWAWHTFNFLDPKPILINTNYIIAIGSGTPAAGTNLVMMDNTHIVNESYSILFNYDDLFPNPAPWSGVSPEFSSMYCTYSFPSESSLSLNLVKNIRRGVPP